MAKTSKARNPEVTTEKASFTVLTPLRHDGARYAPGEIVLLDAGTEAPALIALGVVVPAPETAPASGASSSETAPAA